MIARASRSKGTGESLDETVFDRLADRLSYVEGDFGDDATYERVAEAIDGTKTPVFYLEIPPFLFGRVVKGLADAGPHQDRARRRGEAVRARSCVRDASSRTSSTSTWTSPSSTGSTTTSGRWGSRRSSTCASRTRCSSRSGTGTTSSRVQITMAEDFGVEDRGHFYDPVGALRDVVVNHLMQVVAAAAMEIACQAVIRRVIKDTQVALFHAVADADPAHYVRGQYDGYLDIDGVAVGLDDRDLRRAPARNRELALGGRSVLHPDGQAPRGDADRAPPRLQASRRSSGSSCATGRNPNRTSSSSSSIRRRGSGSSSTRIARDRVAERRPSTLDMEFAEEGGEGPTPVRGAAARRDGRRQRRASRARTASRRRGGSCSRCSTSRRRSTHTRPGSWGPKEADALVAGHGRWQEPWIEQ